VHFASDRVVGTIDLRHVDLDQGPDDDALSRTDEFGRELRRRRSDSPSARDALRDLALVLAGAALALLAVWAVASAGRLFTNREFGFLVHLAFGIVIVHFFAGGLAALVGRAASRVKETVRVLTAVGMAVVAWLTVISGTWMVYPGYRAEPPAGTTDLSPYPKYALEEAGDLAFWHTFGMEWKEHVGWLTPFLATAVAFAVLRYGDLVSSEAAVRRAVTGLFVLAFLAAVVAAALGAIINTVAPNDFLDVASAVAADRG
jgi:hypothetical protein